MRIIHFQSFNFQPNTLYQLSGVLKLNDQIELLNCLFVWDFLYGELPPKLKTYFTRSSDVHRRNLRSNDSNNLFVTHSRTVRYGLLSIKHQSVRSWNNLPAHLKTYTTYRHSKTAFSSELKQSYLDSYN